MKKIIFILMALTMVSCAVNTDSSYNDTTFEAKTAKYLAFSSGAEYYLVKTFGGTHSDEGGEYRYILFNVQGSGGRSAIGIKQYIGSDKINLYPGVPSTTVSEEIPNFERNGPAETLKQKSDRTGGTYLTYIKYQKKTEGLIMFFSGDE